VGSVPESEAWGRRSEADRLGLARGGDSRMQTPSFADGLGRRVTIPGKGGEVLESLRLCAEIGDRPVIQAALVERAALLSSFQHPAFAAVRRIERYSGIGGGLAIVSAATPGIRVSDMLRQSERRMTPRDPAAALHLLQQAVAAVSALHASSRDAFHGALGPERLVVRADSSLVVVEHVLAGALEELRLSRSALWWLFRIAVPPAAGDVRFDQQTDVMQLGVLALSLFLGRVLLRDEFPNHLPDLLETAASADDRQGLPALSRPVRLWIGRALHFDPRTAFRTAIEAAGSLAAAMAEGEMAVPTADAVRRVLAANALNPASPVGGVERAGMSHLTVTPLHGSPLARVLGDAADCESASERGMADSSSLQVQVLADLSAAPPGPVIDAANAGARAHTSSGMQGRTRSGAVQRASTPSRPAAAARALQVVRYGRPRFAVVIAGLVLLWGVSFLGARAYFALPPAPAPSGTLVVESRPAGVELKVDGRAVGRTPVTLVLPPGEHSLAFQLARGPVVVPAHVDAGTARTERVDLRVTRTRKRP
jgi:hypothetical protein